MKSKVNDPHLNSIVEQKLSYVIIMFMRFYPSAFVMI